MNSVWISVVRDLKLNKNDWIKVTCAQLLAEGQDVVLISFICIIFPSYLDLNVTGLVFHNFVFFVSLACPPLDAIQIHRTIHNINNNKQQNV